MTKNYNKDIMDWKEFPTYDMIWCDPPWGSGLVKMFETMQFKQTGIKRPENTIRDILGQLARLADTSKPLVIEYSLKKANEVIDIVTHYGHTKHKIFKGVYWLNREFAIIVFNAPINVVTDRTDQKIVIDTLNAMDQKPSVVFDPFAGIGATATAVRSTGATYIGSELNPARFKKLSKINT